MSNAFDDIPTVSEVSAASADGPNAFDDIAPPPPKRKDAPKPLVSGQPAGPDLSENLGFNMPNLKATVQAMPRQLGHIATSVLTGIPAMAGDWLTGVHNNIIEPAHNLIDPSYKEQPAEMPSAQINRWANNTFGEPQSKAERISNVLSSMVAGGAAGSKNAPAALRELVSPSALSDGSNAMNIPMSQSLSRTADQAAQDAVINSGATRTAAAAKQDALIRTLKQQQDDGFVVPPATTNPTLKNQAVETIAGKIMTQQGASVKNHETAQKLAARANGLNEDVPVTADALKAVRAEASGDYNAIARVGNIPSTKNYTDTVSAIRDEAASLQKSFPDAPVSPVVKAAQAALVPQMDAGHALKMVRVLRDQATEAFKDGRTEDMAGYKKIAKALEDNIDEAVSRRSMQAPQGNPFTTGSPASRTGIPPQTPIPPGLVQRYRDARQRIAISHSTEEALTPDGVSIQKLAKSGDPLSGELSRIRDFGQRYEKAAQSPSKIGSVGVNHAEGGLALATSLLGEHTLGPAGLAAGLVLPMARRGAKAYALSDWGQAGGIPKALKDVGPTKAKAAALAQMLHQFSPVDEANP